MTNSYKLTQPNPSPSQPPTSTGTGVQNTSSATQTWVSVHPDETSSDDQSSEGQNEEPSPPPQGNNNGYPATSNMGYQVYQAPDHDNPTSSRDDPCKVDNFSGPVQNYQITYNPQQAYYLPPPYPSQNQRMSYACRQCLIISAVLIVCGGIIIAIALLVPSNSGRSRGGYTTTTYHSTGGYRSSYRYRPSYSYRRYNSRRG